LAIELQAWIAREVGEGVQDMAILRFSLTWDHELQAPSSVYLSSF
jgi:hypothetical protein